MHVRSSSFASRSCRGHAAPTEALLGAAMLAALAASVPAQRQFDELHKRGWPVDNEATGAVALGDVDGDGDLDVVFGSSGGQNRLYLNDGKGCFTEATAVRFPVDSDNTSAVALGDVDGDGDLDIVFGSAGGQNRLYLNDGTGAYTDATAARMPVDSDSTRAAALGDVDGDGDLDVVFGSSGGQNRLYLNDGTGTYTDVTAARLPADSDISFAVALGDVDGDGEPDLVFGNLTGQNRLYLNDGTGTFTDATASRMPYDRDLTWAVALGDVDRDGDLDLVVGNLVGQNRLYLNDGTGRYTSAARLPAHTDSTRAVALGDVDGDGDPDLVFGNGGQNRLYLNDGTGTFTDATTARLPGDGAFAVALGDVNGDGDPDVVFGNGGQNRLFLNDGTGTFTDATAARMPPDVDDTKAVALGDVDGDGDPDLVFGNGGQNRLYLNDGTGTYTDATALRMPIVRDYAQAAALGDVDGDGDLDIVFGNYQSRNRLYLNDGSGVFTDDVARLPIDIDITQAVALGDVDGDGDLDIVFGNYFTQNRLFLNDGTGTFSDATAARMPLENDGTWAVALGDVDGDGDLDLVFGNYPERNRLYLNTGSGTFTDATAGLPVDGDFTRAVALGDVDGDGDLDVVFGNDGQRNRLHLNSGSGIYTDATAARLPADTALAVALDDVDGDGDLDIVLGGYNRQNRLYLNTGGGTFVDATAVRMPAGLTDTQAVALGDVDGDGDLDVVCGSGFSGSGRQNRLYLNLHRQLDAPFLSRIGQTCTLEAYARYGAPSVVDVALPILSTGTASIPLPPFGTFRLDPDELFPLPPILISQPAGVGSVSFTVPNLPGLVGTPIHAQALLLPYPLQAQLTNLTTNGIIR